MGISFVDLLFVAFGISLIVICAKRGFILSLIKFFKMLISAIAAYLWGGVFGRFVGEKILNTPIRNSVYKKVNDAYLNATDGFQPEQALPNYLKNDAMLQKLNGLEGSGDALVNSVTDTVSEAISAVVCGVIGFLLVFVATFLALSVICLLVQGMKKIFRTFGVADTVFGGVLGFVFAWLVLLFAGSLMKFFFGNQPVYEDSSVVKFFGESTLLESLRFLDLGSWFDNLLYPKA